MIKEIAESKSLSSFKLFYNLKRFFFFFLNKHRKFLRQKSGLLSIQALKKNPSFNHENIYNSEHTDGKCDHQIYNDMYSKLCRNNLNY